MDAKRYAAYADMIAYQKTREFQEAYAKKHSCPNIPRPSTIIREQFSTRKPANANATVNVML